MTKPRIGVLTSGGDCPGLNAVIRGVVLAAEKLGWEVLGFLDGFEGLLPPGNYKSLCRRDTAGIMPRGGTIIGTTNRGHFVAKVGAGERAEVAEKVIADAREVLKSLGVNGLIIVGGDGSMATAQQLQDAGINCIGVPKTIDNDLEATAMTFGFDSAVATVMDAIFEQIARQPLGGVARIEHVRNLVHDMIEIDALMIGGDQGHRATVEQFIGQRHALHGLPFPAQHGLH